MRYSEAELTSYFPETDYKISRLIGEEEKKILQQLIEAIAAEFDVATTLSDPDGTPVFPYSNFTELCHEHIRGCEEGLKRCKMEASVQGSLAEREGKPRVYQCHAGVTDFIAPIMLLNRRIGNISGGQIWAKKPDAAVRERFERYFDEIGVKNKQKALASLAMQKVNDPNKIEKLASIYHYIGKLLSNYFHFQAEYGYWKQSLLALNAELEQRIGQRTELLEETVRDLNMAQELLRSQNEELRRNAEIQSVQSQLLNQLQEAVVITDRDSRIIYWNKTAESLFGYTAEAVRGCDAALLFGGEGASRTEQMQQVISQTVAGGRSTMEVMARHREGETFPAQLFSVLLRDMSGEFSGIAMFSMDMSRLRTAEEAVSRIRLEHERQLYLTKLIEANEPVNVGSERKAIELGLDFSRPFVVAVLEVESSTSRPGTRDPLAGHLIGWLAATGVLAWEYRDSVVILRFGNPDDPALGDLVGHAFRKLESQLQGLDAGAKLLMGIGEPGAALADLQNSYLQARQAAWFCHVVNGPGKPCHYRDMGIFQLFTPVWDANLDAFGKQVLGKLLALKPLKRAEYLATLEALLSEGTQKAAAEKLYVHEKTIKFRKGKIEEALGYSVDSAAHKMALALALRWWKRKNF